MLFYRGLNFVFKDRLKFQKVLEAYGNLNNSHLRRIYDEKLQVNSKKPNKTN